MHVLRLLPSEHARRARKRRTVTYDAVITTDVAGSCFFDSTARIKIHSARRNPTVFMALLRMVWYGLSVDGNETVAVAARTVGPVHVRGGTATDDRTAGINPGRRSIHQDQTIQGTRRAKKSASSVGYLSVTHLPRAKTNEKTNIE